MAVRSFVMEHFRSTLATTAIAVFGLAVAAHSLHPSNRDVLTTPPRPVAAVAQPAAWTDPPARLAAPETTGAIRTDLRSVVPANPLPSAVPAPQQAAVMPPLASPLPAEMAGSSEPLRKAVVARRPKGNERAAHRSARLRHAALARTAAVDRTAAPAAPQAVQAAPAAASRIDPIGDILRGLGLGRDS
ncbi:MAG: hypothetical protein INR63_06345 [Actinomycetospora chiangmaiensis]|nr:hypothetical protein [Actinomycetospora chiangmaiensis]